MDTSLLLHRLPQDTLHHIFSNLPLRQIIICKSVCKFFNQILTSPSFLTLISTKSPPLRLIALRPSRRRHHHRHVASRNSFLLHVFDPQQNQWLRFDLNFLPCKIPTPVASSLGLVYLWTESDSTDSSKSLIVCNPLTREFRLLPQLGSAWSRHGTVLVGSDRRVLVLTELAAFYYCDSGTGNWLKFSSNLPSKPRSPILVSDSIFALCDVGSPWRSQWKLFTCTLTELEKSSGWNRLERHEWGDIFDILKRPFLIQGKKSRILMVGGLKSLRASCSTILILRLDLGTLVWDEAGRMPLDMFDCFPESSKFKVFGGEDRVCFSARRVKGLAMWDCSIKGGIGEWKWIDGVPGEEDDGDCLSRGFEFEASLNALP